MISLPLSGYYGKPGSYKEAVCKELPFLCVEFFHLLAKDYTLLGHGLLGFGLSIRLRADTLRTDKEVMSP
jgi:hypothetical protein